VTGLPPASDHRHTVGALRWYSRHWPGVPGVSGADAPVALLLHGTGASAHSFERLAPLMAARFNVWAPDLPGHARTGAPATQALDLPSVARATGEWLASQGLRPALIVGHSAGAAVALRLVLDDLALPPQGVVAINGALLPLQGWAGQLFLPLARTLVKQPLVPRFFSAAASQPMVLQRLLASTGSRLDAQGADAYAQLVAQPEHTANVLRLMASWDLAPLAADLPRLRTALQLIVGMRDRTISPAQAHEVQMRVPQATVHELPGLGHLAHEEDAAAVWRLIAIR
jgi:magnesium chelatase accessory protein